MRQPASPRDVTCGPDTGNIGGAAFVHANAAGIEVDSEHFEAKPLHVGPASSGQQNHIGRNLPDGPVHVHTHNGWGDGFHPHARVEGDTLGGQFALTRVNEEFAEWAPRDLAILMVSDTDGKGPQLPDVIARADVQLPFAGKLTGSQIEGCPLFSTNL